MNNEAIMDKVNQFVDKINRSIIINTLMRGMLVAIPAIMAGSFATILMNLQIAAYQEFLVNTGIRTILEIITVVTINFTALYTVFGIAYSYTQQKEQDGVPAGVIALTMFFIMTPINIIDTGFGFNEYSLPSTWLGAQGVFSAIIIGLVVGHIYSFLKIKNWTIKLPSSVPPVISSSFSAIIPGIVLATLFGVISYIFSNTPFGSRHQAIYSILQMPIQNVGTSIWSLILIIFIGQALWLIGIHGPMVVMSIAMIAWRPADLANLTAFNAGAELPNIVGYAFFYLSTFAGAGVGLAICMLFAKSKRYKSLGKLTIVPAAFGITEPLIFGTPIIMNLKLAIPHVLLPILSAVIGYIATILGILPQVSGIGLPIGTPVVLYGFLQGGWIMAIFQALLVVLWTAGFYPFFKSLDKEAYELELSEEKQEESQYNKNDKGVGANA